MTEHVLQNTVERLFLGRLFLGFVVPERLSTREYAETYRWLTSDVTSDPGRMDCMKTPAMLFPMECLDNPHIPLIVAKKAAQISWTETINTYISKRIDIDPQSIIIAFPSSKASKDYANEKFRIMVKNSPRLLKKIGDPEKCCFNFYTYPGGFIKYVTAGSVTALKSTPAPILIVEEPDDLKEDLKGQGDALTIFEERQKTYPEGKLIFGGTPGEAGFSKVSAAYESSNQMRFLAHCHQCGDLQPLSFENLKCDRYQDGFVHNLYGRYNPKTAYYECPTCQAMWDDSDKTKNILEGLNFNNLGWKAYADSEVYGFHFLELLSILQGSALNKLMAKKLKAETELEKQRTGSSSKVVTSLGFGSKPSVLVIGPIATV
jgi:phage terminase large subunit GpA-like protein